MRLAIVSIEYTRLRLSILRYIYLHFLATSIKFYLYRLPVLCFTESLSSTIDGCDCCGNVTIALYIIIKFRFTNKEIVKNGCYIV